LSGTIQNSQQQWLHIDYQFKGNKMKKLSALLISGTLLTTAAQAQQNPFSYNFIQAGYSIGTVKVDLVPGSVDTSGYGVSASGLVSENIFLTGSYGTQELKYDSLSGDQDQWTLGLGYRTPINSQTDLVGLISYISTDGDLGQYTGGSIDLGVRHALSESLELNGSVGLIILGEDNDRTIGATVGLRYKVAQNTSIGLSVSASDNDGGSGTSGGLSARFEF
jgi:hypothetical protein